MNIICLISSITHSGIIVSKEIQDKQMYLKQMKKPGHTLGANQVVDRAKVRHEPQIRISSEYLL